VQRLRQGARGQAFASGCDIVHVGLGGALYQMKLTFRTLFPALGLF
jgi:hypothetical protein